MLFNGMMITVHSQIPSIKKMEDWGQYSVQVNASWRPDCVEENSLLDELINDPNEYVLGEILKTQRHAQRLCQQSIGDIESARADLTTQRYEELRAQFAFTSEFLDIYERIAELFVRARMRKDKTPQGNAEAIASALDALRTRADYADAHYGPESIVQGADLRRFVTEAAERAKESQQ
jgi:hypothetical protein